ncbi:uncharacterized protein si:ch211-1a19.3 [Clinocottus analis]|uniref:uncharacterized protein si:ch211-1a19.3 n=1 Tax=Clinocottus analis TaxID=304258 RepID=UPI0035BFF96C
MAGSGSSHPVRGVVLALLAVWSVVSLVVIVVWATSPDLKSSAACRAELQEVREKMEGAKVVSLQNQQSLERLLEDARQELAAQKAEGRLVLDRLHAANASLQSCRHDREVLNWNISVLQETVESLRQTEFNLSAQIDLQEDHMEALQQNLTEAGHQLQSSSSLRAAAEKHMQAAQSQTLACESREQYLHKQLLKCKDVDSGAAQETQQQDPASSSSPSSSSLSGLPVLVLLLCRALIP